MSHAKGPCPRLYPQQPSTKTERMRFSRCSASANWFRNTTPGLASGAIFFQQPASSSQGHSWYYKDKASPLRFFLYFLACLAVDDDIAERGGARAGPVLNEDAEDVVLIQRGSALQLLRSAFEGEGRTALWEELGARVAAKGREQLDRAWVLRAALGLWYAEEARGAEAAALLFASGDDGRGR